MCRRNIYILSSCRLSGQGRSYNKLLIISLKQGPPTYLKRNELWAVGHHIQFGSHTLVQLQYLQYTTCTLYDSITWSTDQYLITSLSTDKNFSEDVQNRNSRVRVANNSQRLRWHCDCIVKDYSDTVSAHSTVCQHQLRVVNDYPDTVSAQSTQIFRLSSRNRKISQNRFFFIWADVEFFNNIKMGRISRDNVPLIKLWCTANLFNNVSVFFF